MNAMFEQELSDACTAMEQARESGKNNDVAMLITALKDARKRVNRLLKAMNTGTPRVGIDPQLPTEPNLPIKDGEV